MHQSLKDQVALVTGGTAGIGRAIAKAFAEAGAKVIIVGTNAERGERAAAELGDHVRFLQLDVSQAADVEAAVKDIVKEYGSLDVLVNNAGITRDNLILRMNEDDWDRVMSVNLKSCYNACKSATRPMMKQRRGKMILLSSIVGQIGSAGQTNYAASKAGMIGFARSLAKELASRGITVNCIAPGFIDTAMTQSLSEKTREDLLENIPLGRMGQPEEIAAAALYLASPAGDYITGQTLTIDGGMVL